MSTARRILLIGIPSAGLALAAQSVGGEDLSMKCADIQVTNFRDAPVGQLDPRFRTSPFIISDTLKSGAAASFQVTVGGPMLSSSDRPFPVETEFSCTDRGILLTAKITRSSKGEGSAAMNELWSPRFDITVKMTGSRTSVFEVKWLMRLDTGKPITDYVTAGVPSNMLPSYPILLATRLGRDH